MIETLVQQREQIEAQIREIRATERSSILATVRDLIRLHDISANEVFERKGAARPASRRKPAPKYRDPSSGTTWTGRGRAPLWFDKSRVQDFAL